MAVETEGRNLDARLEEVPDFGVNPTEDTTGTGKSAERNSLRSPLPWIGAFSNPHVGPMVVVNETGYLVPLLTAGDLLHLCKYYWRQSHA
jgi:hypothetical protein